MPSDFFTSDFGTIRPLHWRKYWKLLRALDRLYDWRIARSLRRMYPAMGKMPPQRVLLAAVEAPGHECDLARVIRELTDGTFQQVTVSTVPMEDRSKCDNINLAIADYDLSRFDWLMIVDDDISVPHRFMDKFIFFCWRHHLNLAQPAHRFRSYATFSVTERHWGTMVRQSGFVEIGPVTLIHASLFDRLIPFPGLKYAWGLDVLWADMAKREKWRLGIVDATPISHLRPVGRTYNMSAALEEAETFLAQHDVASRKSDLLRTVAKI